MIATAENKNRSRRRRWFPLVGFCAIVFLLARFAVIPLIEQMRIDSASPVADNHYAESTESVLKLPTDCGDRVFWVVSSRSGGSDAVEEAIFIIPIEATPPEYPQVTIQRSKAERVSGYDLNLYPVWDKSGDKIAFVEGLTGAIVLLSFSSGEQTSYPVGTDFGPRLSWNDSGTMMAFNGGNSLCMFDLKAEETRTIKTFSNDQLVRDLALAPNGDAVAFIVENSSGKWRAKNNSETVRGARFYDGIDAHVFVLSIDTGKTTLIKTNGERLSSGALIRWFPDSRGFVFAVESSDNGADRHLKCLRSSQNVVPCEAGDLRSVYYQDVRFWKLPEGLGKLE